MYMYIYIYMCIYIHVYIYIYMYVYTHIYMYIYMYIHVYIYTCIYIYMYIYIYIYTYKYTCKYIYIHISILYIEHIHSYIDTYYLYVHIYIYTHTIFDHALLFPLVLPLLRGTAGLIMRCLCFLISAWSGCAWALGLGSTERTRTRGQPRHSAKGGTRTDWQL